jgi:outer membrane protein, multidrug efflux system
MKKKLLVILLVVVTGCSYLPRVGPDFVAPNPVVPEHWTALQEGEKTAKETSANLKDWWMVFGDHTLNELVEKAVAENKDYKIAQSRIRQARAALRIAGASLLPAVDSSASFSRLQRSSNISNPTSLTATGQGQSFGAVNASNLYQLGLDSSWEIDIFGGLERNREAAEADYFTTEEALGDVLITLVSEVARNYIDLRTAEKELAIAQHNISIQTDTLSLVEARYNAGLTSELDVAQAKAQLGETKATLPVQQTRRDTDLYALATLLGVQPPEIHALLPAEPDKWDPTEALASSPALVPLGLPSELLRRRPDIRQAENQLHAATARIGVAKADLFPKFSITGSYGFQSRNSGNLLDAGSEFWSFMPGISWPVFAGGRILANIDLQNEAQIQVLNLYEKTVLQALAETETALVAYQNEKARYDLLSEALKHHKRSLELSQELYTKGLSDFLSVLDSQRSLYLAEELRAESEHDVIVDLIALYKTLGGGWESVREPPQAP